MQQNTKYKQDIIELVATAGAATVSLNGGPVITLVQNEFILLKGGKPGQATIVKAVSDSTGDYILGLIYMQQVPTGDFIAVEDNSTSPAIDSNFLSQEPQVKRSLLSQEIQLHTDIDSSSGAADYTFAKSSSNC